MKKQSLRTLVAALMASAFVAPADARDATKSDLAHLFATVGGKQTVERLTNYRSTAIGETFVPSSGHIPGGPNISGTSYRIETTVDVGKQRLRLEAERDISFNLWEFRPNPKTKYVKVLTSDRGYVSGVDNIIQLPERPLLPEQVASEWKTQELLNPVLIVKDVADGKRRILSVVEGRRGVVTYTVSDDIAPISLLVRHGRVVELQTKELRPDRRDTKLTVTYANWTGAAGLFPTKVEIALDGAVIRTERRSVERGVAIADADFAFPADGPGQLAAFVAKAPPFVASWYGVADASGVPALFRPTAEFLAWGRRSSQFIESFSNVGVPFAGRDGLVVPQKIADGVTMLVGSTHHSLLVEQSNRLVLVEAPLSPERSAAIEAYAAKAFPGKSISHVVVTHHHYDHVAGLRYFVAKGAKIVTSAVSAGYLSEMFERASTLAPDRQAAVRNTPRFEIVALNGAVVVDDALRPVTAHAIKTRHAADMVVAHVAKQKTLFVSDVYSPPLPPLSATEFSEFAAEIERLRLDVEVFAGGHVGTADRATYEKTLADVRAQTGR